MKEIRNAECGIRNGSERDLKIRTQQFALSVIRFVDTLPKNRTSDIIARQLIRCATSVGANYSAACRGKSLRDFVAKLAIVEEEADECLYWFELLNQSEITIATEITPLASEANELLAIIVSSIRTARRNANS